MSSGRKEYLRRKFIEKGPSALLRRDALELLLGFAYDDRQAFEVSNRLFEKYFRLETILNLDCKSLLSVEGMTEEAAIMLSSLKTLNYLNVSERRARCVLTDPAEACAFFADRYRGAKSESFKVVGLSERGRPIRCSTSPAGTTYGVSVSPEWVAERVIEDGCKNCIVAHNHPGSSCIPSLTDVKSNEQLAKYLAERGINLADHVIVGSDGSWSMAGGSSLGIVPRAKFF